MGNTATLKSTPVRSLRFRKCSLIEQCGFSAASSAGYITSKTHGFVADTVAGTKTTKTVGPNVGNVIYR